MSHSQDLNFFEKMGSRQLTGEQLEVLGKNAAAEWSSGRSKSLTDAVVSAVKTASLSTEQVKRVVEFANTAAYLSEFHKEGASHKVVDFGGQGPASPSEVLQSLNYAGHSTETASGSSDYHMPPSSQKTASAWEETAFSQMFPSTEASYPEENPLGDAIDIRDKLASAYETTTSMMSGLEVEYDDLSNRIFGHVKQAALAGHSLSEIVELWSREGSDEHVKVAFSTILPRLVENEVFRTYESAVDSLAKHASVGMIDPNHPLLSDFRDFCGTVTKLAELREAQQELGEGASRLTAFLKAAAAGKAFVDHAGSALGWMGQKGKRTGEFVGSRILGLSPEAVATAGNVGEIAGKYVIPGVAAHEAYRRTLKYSPTFNEAKSFVPGTREYRQKEMELAARAQGY